MAINLVDAFPVHIGRNAGLFLEKPSEMLRVLKAQFIGNLAHRKICLRNEIFGPLYQFILNIFLRRSSGLFFDQIPFVATLPTGRVIFIAIILCRESLV